MIFLKMVVGNVSYNNRVNLDLNKCTNSKNEPLNPNIIDLLEKMLKVNQK